ncbi:hypothetical protein [Kitasatospora purpeofusca]|uniref:hypothetical protein n=1 Tax=Kitasatospora purpeofusca TaxID=67352 RepID=UPI0036D34F38
MTPFEPPVIGVAPTLADSIGCGCVLKTAGGCVEDLKLPRLQEVYRHTDGREGVFLGRRRHGDPTTGTVTSTVVLFRSRVGGKSVVWALKCSGPKPVENQYEQRRPDRPPTAARRPFQPARPPT